ncbi:hypothetical protein B0H34DRAFT_650806 [Crassisporium funariophilum]|nr:hypothetical protein B0H34DRAFT_650806 [Crassisporium funariophilum]
MSDSTDILRNVALPITSATITVRIIKSFKFRTERSLVLHDVNLETTTIACAHLCLHSLPLILNHCPLAVATQPGWKPYRNAVLDTLKLYTKAHGAKTSNLIINLDHDEWILDDDCKPLVALGFENETEVSYFNRQDYEEFKINPEVCWRTLTQSFSAQSMIIDKLGRLKLSILNGVCITVAKV